MQLNLHRILWNFQLPPQFCSLDCNSSGFPPRKSPAFHTTTLPQAKWKYPKVLHSFVHRATDKKWIPQYLQPPHGTETDGAGIRMPRRDGEAGHWERKQPLQGTKVECRALSCCRWDRSPVPLAEQKQEQDNFKASPKTGSYLLSRHDFKLCIKAPALSFIWSVIYRLRIIKKNSLNIIFKESTFSWIFITYSLYFITCRFMNIFSTTVVCQAHIKQF